MMRVIIVCLEILDPVYTILEENLNPGVTFTNLTCDYSFSLRSNLTNINFITIDDGFRFFNCSTHSKYVLYKIYICKWIREAHHVVMNIF